MVIHCSQTPAVPIGEGVRGEKRKLQQQLQRSLVTGSGASITPKVIHFPQ